MERQCRRFKQKKRYSIFLVGKWTDSCSSEGPLSVSPLEPCQLFGYERVEYVSIWFTQGWECTSEEGRGKERRGSRGSFKEVTTLVDHEVSAGK